MFSGKFDCYVYHGLKLCSSRNEPPTNVFICVLRSCHSFDGKRPYIMAKNCEKVGTMVCNKNIYCIFIWVWGPNGDHKCHI